MPHDCTVRPGPNYIIKSADDATLVGLISNNMETANRVEVEQLVHCCQFNNLSLNLDTTEEMIVDFSKSRVHHSPLLLHGSPVEPLCIWTCTCQMTPCTWPENSQTDES